MLTNWSDGHNHIYLYSYDQGNTGIASAKLERQLTKGDFEVADVAKVDHAGKMIRYASNEGNLLQQQLWQVSFDGERKQLTTGAGTHAGNFAPAGESFVDTQSSSMEPPTLRLCLTADKCNVFWSTRALEAYGLHAPKQVEVKAHDGTTLYGTLLLPEGSANGSSSPASVPLIVNPYGGPGPQTVADRWSDSLLFTSCWPSTDSRCCMRTTGARECVGGILPRLPITTLGPSSLKISSRYWMPCWRNTRNSISSAWAGGAGAGAERLRSMRCPTDRFPRRRRRGAGDGLAQLRLNLYRALHVSEPGGFSGRLQGFFGGEFGSQFEGPVAAGPRYGRR